MKWLKDHEKLLIPIYLLAIYLWVFHPEYLVFVGVPFIIFKIHEIATDRSNNSMLKEIKKKENVGTDNKI